MIGLAENFSTNTPRPAMHIDSKQSAAFLAVAEAGSFEQAAVALHLTPSAVSLRVRALETQLGQALLVRGRPCRATRAGRQLMQHLQRARAMERELLADMAGDGNGEQRAFSAFSLAVNADSLATWLLPSLVPALQRERIALELLADDQEHTHALLEAGLVHACIASQAQAMRGCVAEPLGAMRYRLVCSPDFASEWFPRGISRASARQAPVVVFNRKDALQAQVLREAFGLQASSCPCHFVPASEPLLAAVRCGLGYGMVPALQIQGAVERGELVDLLPSAAIDVALYWHSWRQQPPRLERLARSAMQAARRVLQPLPGTGP